jgi:hypothetical protein
VELLLHRIIVLLTNGTLLFDLLPSRAMLARDIDGICFLPYHLIYHLKRLFNYFLKNYFLYILLVGHITIIKNIDFGVNIFYLTRTISSRCFCTIILPEKID